MCTVSLRDLSPRSTTLDTGTGPSLEKKTNLGMVCRDKQAAIVSRL